MARKQVAILSINRGVTTLNGLVVEPDPGEDPHQAGIRAVTEQIAAPSRKKVQVVATDDVERIRMYVHPDGRVTDIETLEVFEPPASAGQEPGAGWAPVPPRWAEPEEATSYDAGDEAVEEEPAAVEPAEPAEQVHEEVPERERTAERPAVRAPLAAPVETDEVPERERTAERPAVRMPLARPGERPEETRATEPDADDDVEADATGGPPPVVPAPAGEPQPLSAEAPEEPDHILDEDAEQEPEETPAVVVAPAAPAYDEPERLPVQRAGGAGYARPRPRVTTRGRVVLVVAAIILLILLYSAVRAVVSGTTGGPDHAAHHGGAGPTATASSSVASPRGTVSATTLEPSPTPPPTPTRTAAPKRTHSARPALTRTLRVKAISETEAIKLVITASRLPVTATIRMDPWGAPEPFTRTVRLTEPGQAVLVKPVASGHAKWSVSVAGARKVTGYTHSWPRGKRTYVKR